MADRTTLYLYAAYPMPMPENWLGWERVGPHGAPRYREMVLSWSYKPEWEVWRRVAPSHAEVAQRWAAAARRKGYHVVFPLAWADTKAERRTQGRILTEALRYFAKRRAPRGLLAKRAALIKQYPGIPRPRLRNLPPGERGTASELPWFPQGIPEFGFPLKVENPSWEQYRSRRQHWQRRPRTADERMRQKLAPKPFRLKGVPGPLGLGKIL